MPSPVIPSIFSERKVFFSEFERIGAKEISKATPSDEMI
jgi:hypothetical protein